MKRKWFVFGMVAVLLVQMTGPGQMVKAAADLTAYIMQGELAQRRQFEPAEGGAFWRTTVFFVLVLRQQDCVLQPCISPKCTTSVEDFETVIL